MKARMMSVLALILLLPLAACDDGTAIQGEGTFTLLLTDDPDFEEVWVTIEEIDLVGSDGVVNLYPGDLAPESEPGPINLLALSNEVLPLVREVPVGPGTFSQLRIVVSEACVATDEGKVFATEGYEHCGTENVGHLQIPSYSTSGFKIQLPGGSMTIEGGRSIVLIDIVVGESFAHEAGNSDRMVFHPHVKATEIGFSGTITAELTAEAGAYDPLSESVLDPAPSLGDFEAQLWAMGSDWVMDGQAVPFTEVEEGLYSAFFEFLVPGDYRVYLNLPPREGETEAPYGFAADPEPEEAEFYFEVTVEESEDESGAFVVTCAFPTGEDATACAAGSP